MSGDGNRWSLFSAGRGRKLDKSCRLSRFCGRLRGAAAQAENFARSPESVKERLDSDDQMSKIPLNELSKRVDAFSPHVNLPNRGFPRGPGRLLQLFLLRFVSVHLGILGVFCLFEVFIGRPPHLSRLTSPARGSTAEGINAS
jgi:hypothetical protein